MSKRDNVIQGNFWDKGGGAPIDGGGGPPHSYGMEQRVKTLEDKMGEVQKTLSGIDVTLARLEGRLDLIDERISHLPTYKGIWALVAGIITTTSVVIGVIATVLHLFHVS